MHNELSLIAAFVKRSKRDRYREILSNSRLRHKFTNQLANFTDFDPTWRLAMLPLMKGGFLPGIVSPCMHMW